MDSDGNAWLDKLSLKQNNNNFYINLVDKTLLQITLIFTLLNQKKISITGYEIQLFIFKNSIYQVCV